MMLTITRNEGHRRFEVIYGLKDGRFTMIVEIKRMSASGTWKAMAFGHLIELIAKHFPQLKPLARWHLFVQGQGPCNYTQNGIYWFDRFLAGDPAALHSFETAACFGALPGDEVPARTELERWLADRLPRLCTAFEADMAKFGLLENDDGDATEAPQGRVGLAATSQP